MLTQIERYVKTAIVDKDPYVSSCALISSIHLSHSSIEVVRLNTLGLPHNLHDPLKQKNNTSKAIEFDELIQRNDDELFRFADGTRK
jgi:hypothetical protein